MSDTAEIERLRVLQLYNILDSAPEEQYDNIAALVAAILQVPTALINFIDSDRQWFKSAIGFDAREASLDTSFCKHMIPTRQPLVVNDAEQDDRFKDNAAVTEEPHVRFYAGVPIQAREGVVLGALCGVDYKAREISEEQLRALKILGQQVADQLELRRTAMELQDALQDVTVAQKARELFFASISHDIRTPAIGILGASQLLLKSDLPETEEKLINGIESNGKMLLHLLNNLLDLAKMESGGFVLEDTVIDLNALAEEARSALDSQARHKGLYLRVDTQLSAPLYRGDALRISQILWNLISNAIKFTSEGGICVSLQSTSDGIEIEVADSGIGISADKLERIFEAFSQAETSTQRDFGGTGLGLAIVREIASAMGGSVSVRSKLGQGTTFSVELPLTPVSPAQKIAAKRVLVVEDSEVNQLVLTSMLEDLGMTVEVAANCEEAQIELAGEPFDAVFMDCELPDGSGIDLAEELRKSNRDVRIFGISAHTAPAYREKCLEVGMNGCLSKPFREEELRVALSE